VHEKRSNCQFHAFSTEIKKITLLAVSHHLGSLLLDRHPVADRMRLLPLTTAAASNFVGVVVDAVVVVVRRCCLHETRHAHYWTIPEGPIAATTAAKRKHGVRLVLICVAGAALGVVLVPVVQVVAPLFLQRFVAELLDEVVQYASGVLAPVFAVVRQDILHVGAAEVVAELRKTQSVRGSDNILQATHFLEALENPSKNPAYFGWPIHTPSIEKLMNSFVMQT
jgi:hypothetical protein